MHDEWLMTDAERATLHSLLTTLKPQCAIEVGVYKAGSLAILAAHSRKVYALDKDPACESAYASRFPNVEFITGLSQNTLPRLIDRIQASGEALEFVLIDADHSVEGVCRDINNILRYRPHRPLYLIMHDSFNPECRGAIMQTDWSSNPHVHMVELDFVVGRFVTKEEGDSYRQMWCGFALGILLPEKRPGDVILHENESLTYQSALRHSIYRFHRWWNPFYSVPQAANRARRTAARILRTHAPQLFESLNARHKKNV
ncbi:MAG: class I SAM-dependent methyltransferase [Sulfuricaulis sp.]|uniref:class I SAM-dependent methyltransferase n=1 Tax=Sulfuricaulis sp. TaxID=2003553 RepID=UPI0034A4BCBF